MPFTRRHHKREPLTQDEANNIASACSLGDERLVIWTLLDTGLRVEEFCELKPASIDWQGHRITVYGKNTLANGSGEKKRRVVPMTPRVRSLVESYFANHDAIEFSIRTANRIVHRVANKARIGRQCSPHILRHTFAVTSLEKGISLPALQKIMGHEDLATTAIYLNLCNQEAIREYREKW